MPPEQKSDVDVLGWTSFGMDCGKRLSRLPRKKALDMRNRIENDLYFAEMEMEESVLKEKSTSNTAAV